MKAIKQTLLAIALASTFTTANATPVDWTLSNVVFSRPDGINISFSGSFTYDADTNSFSNFSVVGGGDSAWTLEDYSSDTYIRFHYTTDSSTYAFISLVSALTNLGGNVELYTDRSTYVNLATGNFLSLTSGTLTGTPQATASAVPEPEAYALMLAGLGLVGFAARRKLAV